MVQSLEKTRDMAGAPAAHGERSSRRIGVSAVGGRQTRVLLDKLAARPLLEHEQAIASGHAEWAP
jgi:hypothetical protein